MSRRNREKNKVPIIVDMSLYSYKEIEDIQKENEQLKTIAKARYETNKKLMTKWINRGNTIKVLNKEILYKDATIRQLEKIIYKLYTGESELSTGDLHNIVRIMEGHDGK